MKRYPLTIYHFDGAALARCNAVIADRDCAADAIERMAACLLAAVCDGEEHEFCPRDARLPA